jgi:hypothetical protein
MRALTVRQPYAWAIVHGQKDVENRSRSLGPYRGPVAIHAALKPDMEAYGDPLILDAWRRTGAWMPTPGCETGVVIGVVNLIAVHRCWTALDGEPHCSPWAVRGRFHLHMANPRPLAEPIPWWGRLGLWTVPDDLEAAIREQGALL